jgi:hypothetical protein
LVTKADIKLTKQVAEFFKSNYRNGPWPSVSDCYGLAVAISIIKNAKSYKKTFEQENERRSDRRATIQSMKRLIRAKKIFLMGQLEGLQLPGMMEDVNNLNRLELALEQAESALLQPFDPLAGTRNAAWWHKAARMIAQQVHSALTQTGRKRISFQKHGAGVGVVVDALKLATGEDFEPATVASVLKNLPINSGTNYLVRFSL